MAPTDPQEMTDLKKRVKKLEDIKFSDTQVDKLVKAICENKEFHDNIFLSFQDRLIESPACRGRITQKYNKIKNCNKTNFVKSSQRTTPMKTRNMTRRKNNAL